MQQVPRPARGRAPIAVVTGPGSRALAWGIGVVLALSLVGCTPPPAGIKITGKVADDSISVQVPALGMPAVNLDAGFAAAPASGGSAPVPLTPRAFGLGSFVRVSSVPVEPGDRVQAGDVLVRFARSALNAQIAAATADARVAAAQVDQLASAIQDTYDKEADIDAARRKVRTAIANLTRSRTQLLAKRTQARAQSAMLPGKLAGVEAQRRALKGQLDTVTDQLCQAEEALEQLPPLAPPEARAQLEQAVAQLTAAKAQLGAGLVQLTAARTQLRRAIGALRKGLQQLEAALVRIEAGLVKARSGLRTLDRAKARITDARATLRGLRAVSRIVAKASKIGISLARNQAGLATATAAVDGVVVRVPGAGELLAPGAPAVWLRPDGQRIISWLSPAQLARSCIGDAVAVRGDWMAEPIEARVTRIGVRAELPPTSFPTDEVHLTRAVEVEVRTADPLASLPVGVPLDLTIFPCRGAGAS